MSAPKKLRGGSDSELTRFKKFWLLTLDESGRDSLRSLFVSDTTQARIREFLQQTYQINLTRDGQLNEFRDWLADQDARDQEAEQMVEDERRFKETNPEISEEELRSKVLLAYYQRALSRGETGLGKAMMRQDLAERRFEFEKDQAAEAKKTDQQRALEYCLEESKRWPAVQDLFKAAFAALKQAKGK